MESDEPQALEVKLVLEAIYLRYGYDFREYQGDSIRRRLEAAAARTGVAHLGELQHRILREPEFFAGVLDMLAVRVTEMFRDPPFYLVLRQRVLPILRTYPQLKIWHAGCASGEEVYAMAILLSEEGLYDRTQIYATDLSTVALEQARDGIYGVDRFESFEDNYARAGGKASLDGYCRKAYNQVAVVEELRRNVHFFQHDLASDYALGDMHVIVCRNVLIYFGEGLRERVFSIFTSGLHRGGFLCLGASEAVPASQKASFEDFAPRERVFRHKGPS